MDDTQRMQPTPRLLAGLVVLACCILTPGIGQARYLFWPGQWHRWNDYPPYRFDHKHSQRGPIPPNKQSTQPIANGPLQIIISVADQRISVYENGGLTARSSVSTGVSTHPTPLGIFSVIGKQRWHRSNIYSAAPMPYMQRITWSGVALHAGELPGHPASHGCIRLRHAFAVQLWRLTKRGTRVIIAQSDVEPIDVTSPHLFQPKPTITSGPPTMTADGDPAPAGEAVKTAAAAADTDVEKAQTVGAQIPGFYPPNAVPRKRRQISVFVSRKAGRLYVRQGSVPLFDAAVTIRDPERPLGTHIFTAMAFNPGDPVVRWSVVSLPEAPIDGMADKAGNHSVHRMPVKSAIKPASIVRTPHQAVAALDRIDVPNSAIDRISELLSPGSSLIVSDQGISNETGADTDFIILTPL
jgi:hypothetical protein